MTRTLRFIIPLLIMALMAPVAAVAATPTASQLVENAAAKMRAAKSLTASFTAKGGPRAAGSKGTFTISGSRFTIDSPRAKVWYDGKTQWTWSADANEVDITEPTVEEVAQINPYAIINSLRSRYKASYVGAASQRTVLLKPTMPNPSVKRAEITFGADGFPTRMKLFMTSGEEMTVTVASVKTGGALPDSTFRFAPAKAPGAEVVDLR